MKYQSKKRQGKWGTAGNQWNKRFRKELPQKKSFFPSFPNPKLPKLLSPLLSSPSLPHTAIIHSHRIVEEIVNKLDEE